MDRHRIIFHNNSVWSEKPYTIIIECLNLITPNTKELEIIYINWNRYTYNFDLSLLLVFAISEHKAEK